MLLQPLARLNSGTALFTPASKSFSMPGLTSIWAISVFVGGALCESARAPQGRAAACAKSPHPRPLRNFALVDVAPAVGERCFAQAGRAQAILVCAGGRERQPVGLGRAPAVARRTALERGAAARANEATGRVRRRCDHGSIRLRGVTTARRRRHSRRFSRRRRP